jgi:tetratricopeptide (TPR) repeat protein
MLAKPVNQARLEAPHRTGPDPLAITPEVSRHVAKLIPNPQVMPALDAALKLFRSVFPASQKVTFGGVAYPGLTREEGGLEIYCNPNDANHIMRRETEGFPLPADLITAREKDFSPAAKCVEYSFLLTALLRAAGLEAYPVKEGLEHVFVAAKLNGQWYKLDAFYISGKIPPRFEPIAKPDYLSDRRSMAMLYCNKAETLRRQCRPEKALNAIQTAIEIEPDSTEAWTNYGTLILSLYKKEGQEEAAQAFERALAIDPNNVCALTNKAVLLIGEGKNDEAGELLRKALEIDPGYESAKRNLWTLNGGPLQFLFGRPL